MWKTYRLHFGGEFGFHGYVEVNPTRMTFRGRTIEEAKKKARKFMREADLRGVFRLEEE